MASLICTCLGQGFSLSSTEALTRKFVKSLHRDDVSLYNSTPSSQLHHRIIIKQDSLNQRDLNGMRDVIINIAVASPAAKILKQLQFFLFFFLSCKGVAGFF